MDERRKLTSDELEAQDGGPVPDREAMSSINIDLGSGIDNFAMPINEAIAINNQTVSSYAIADADQIIDLDMVDED
ncbi:MAG TPA: hypothetical protein VEA78_04555 [Acidimicrobiales bacterium]|nr:hypothetical protein [Acidimicrobiales bacterium]